MAIVGVLLMIGCANIANLMMARNSARRRELSPPSGQGAGKVLRHEVGSGGALVMGG